MLYFWLWATVNLGILSSMNRIDWQIEGGEELSKGAVVFDDVESSQLGGYCGFSLGDERQNANA